MPIEIRQPQPADFAAAYAAGSGDALMRALPSIASLYGTDMRNTAQARMQTEELSARAGMQAAALDSRAQEFQDARQDRAAEFTASRMVQPIDLFRANQQLIEQQQRAQNQAWVAGQELSQREVMQRQHLANSLADVQSDFANNKIDKDTYDAAVAHIRGIKSPLDQKFQKAQIDHLAQQDQEFQRKAAAAASAEQSNAATTAHLTGLGATTVPWVDAKTGERHLLLYNHRTGEVYNPLTPGGRGEGGDVVKARSEWLKGHETAVKEVSGWAKERKPGTTEALYPELQTTDGYNAAVEKLMARRGFPSTAPQFGGQVGGPPQPPAPQPEPSAPPKSATAILDQSMADINDRPLPPEVRVAVNAAIEQSKALLAAKDGYDKLTAAEKEIIDRNRELVRKALAAAPPAPPPAQPAAPPGWGQPAMIRHPFADLHPPIPAGSVVRQ